MIDINQFNFKQLFNDSKGKTSVVLLSGFLGIVIALGGIFAAGNTIVVMTIFKFEKDVNIINFLQMLVMQSLALFSLAAGMLTAHRLSADKEISSTANNPTPPTP